MKNLFPTTLPFFFIILCLSISLCVIDYRYQQTEIELQLKLDEIKTLNTQIELCKTSNDMIYGDIDILLERTLAFWSRKQELIDALGTANMRIKELEDMLHPWSSIMKQLIDLWKEPEKDNYGRLRPTRHAFDRSVCLLVDAAIEANHQQRRIPAGCVSTDSEGGVRIEWRQSTASVHLVIPASKYYMAYIYHEVDNDYAVEDATPERLVYWLLEFSSKEDDGRHN